MHDKDITKTTWLQASSQSECSKRRHGGNGEGEGGGSKTTQRRVYLGRDNVMISLATCFICCSNTLLIKDNMSCDVTIFSSRVVVIVVVLQVVKVLI